MSLEKVVERIEATGEIPTIGAVATEVMRRIADPDADFRSVGSVIEQDPALAAKILRVANSPYYGIPGEVGNLERAVALLGMARVRNIALSVSVMADFTGSYGGKAFNWTRFWEHSAGCALIAETMVRLLRIPGLGTEYVGGLLHDVGKILLGHHFPDGFGRALDAAASRRTPLIDAEREVFGTDHAELGGWLARRWGFPRELRAAIRWHHDPEAAGEGALVASVVHVADLFTKAKCIGFGGDQVAVCLEDDPAWRRIAGASRDLDGLDVVRFTIRLDREVEAARDLARAAGAS